MEDFIQQRGIDLLGCGRKANVSDGSAQVSFSQTGTAVYIAGSTFNNQVTVGLFDGKGLATPLIKQPGDYAAPSFPRTASCLPCKLGPATFRFTIWRAEQ
jgi:hypothetical protein